MKLYELTEMYSDLFNQFDAINEWEPDTNADGMPIDDDGNIIANVDAYRNKMLTAWFDTLTGIEGEFDEKAESIAIYYKQLLAEAKMLKAEKAAIAKRQSQKEKQAESLKTYLFKSMQALGRQKIELLTQGGADDDTITGAKAKYFQRQDEYVKFSKAMGLPQQWERVTVNGKNALGSKLPKKAERFDRRAEYSLDEDNKRIAQTRADEWHDRANTLEEKAKQFSLNTNEQKYYRPVFEEDISKTFERKIEGETITIDTHKANTLCDNVYISDKVKLKRKELHNFDMQVRKAFDMLGEVETSGKPEICIVTPEEMRVNAIASYMPMQNVLNVNSAYFSTSDLSGLQENLACPQDRLSTILHELIHWQDAKNYRAKFGSINDYFEYCDYLNKIYAPKVEKLINNGYNIEDISEYAFECLKDKAMDEVYNEYRVSKLLG